MARCTAPVNGHRTESGAANCPACRHRSRGYRSSYNPPRYSAPYSSPSVSSTSISSGSNKSRSIKASWGSTGSTILYSPAEIRTLTPIRENVEPRLALPDLRDVFLCHAWDDRKEPAKELHDLLEANGVSVWFSEKDVVLGSSLLREIDKGLANSRVGIVLVTPNFLRRVNGGISEIELSALLARDLLVPIMHNVTHDELREVSPLLGSRSGLSTGEESMTDIAAKLSELVNTEVAI